MAREAVGFIGLGIMGSRQAANLARAGYELTVYNRTGERAEAWAAEHGGTVAGSPREVAERSDVVITMVVDGAQVEQMLLGEDGALAGAREGTLFVDMSTIAPATARSLAATTAEAGQGQAVKVLSQGVTAVNCATLAQAITVARRSGVDLDALLDVMTGGSADSTMRELKGRPMADRDFPVLFKLEHMLKDVQLCLEESRGAGASFPFAALAGELYSAGVGRGLGQEDFAAVLEVVEGLTGDGPR